MVPDRQKVRTEIGMDGRTMPKLYSSDMEGAQWLNGRVLDSRPRGREFEPHRRHCIVVLEHDTFILA